MRRDQNQYFFASNARRHERTHRFRNTVLIFLPLILIAVVIMNYTVSNRVRLEEMRLTVLNLPADLEEYSILHISDLHGARFGENQKAIAAALSGSRYSCVVMTGDMLGKDRDPEPLLELIAALPADVPKYLIPGDTDGGFTETTAHGSLSVYADWAVQLQAAGVHLVDRPMKETRGKGTIWFVPEELYMLDLDVTESVYKKQQASMREQAASLTADDAARLREIDYELSRLEEIRALKKEFQPEDIQIVLTHTPLTEEYVANMISWTGKEDYFSMRYAGLILAGHYNGGQWRIPFQGAIYVPELGWFPKDEQIMGLSYLQGIPQHISPGMGSDPHYEKQPGRIFNPPVITKIVLTRKAT
jgi:hypothetical protein